MPTPIYLVARDATSASSVASSLEAIQTDGMIVDTNDRIVLKSSTKNKASVEAHSASATEDPNTVVKQLVMYKDGSVPSSDMTPSFGDIKIYFNTLQSERERLLITRANESEGIKFSIGSVLMYAEVVTSTQTILAGNYKLLKSLPPGIAFAAALQVTGKGRGANIWMSPPGCLQHSFVVRHDTKLGGPASAVFIQYIMAMAVKRAINDRPGYERIPIKLKWPNDIYAIPSPGAQAVKIGGILVTSQMEGSEFVMVVGTGINLTNSEPTTCIADLIKQHNATNADLTPLTVPSPAQLLATILTNFDLLYHVFNSGGFAPLLPEYLESWLHTGQILTIDTSAADTVSAKPSEPARVLVTGVTTDYGLLKGVRVEASGRPISGPNVNVELQPDGNSLDLMNGMIMRKK